MGAENNYFPIEYHILKYLFDENNNFTQLKLKECITELANYFGTNILSINRIFKQLGDDKIIQSDKTKIEIIRPDKLNNSIKKYF